MKQIHFFALREDLLPVLELVEHSGPLKYIRMGQYTRANYDYFEHGAEIPNLGWASTDSASSIEAFLVAPHETAINVRQINAPNGPARYLIDQLANPDTITFTPGGLWGDSVVVSGRIATVSDSVPAQELMKRFSSAICKSFAKIKAFRVGHSAQELLDTGARLTASAQSPREYDLVRRELME